MAEEIIHVIQKWMQGEINNFIKVWLSVYISLIYCYFLPKNLPKGIPRFLTILPIIFLFLYLPLHLHTMTLVGFTSFFISWLANFKLIMFVFGISPLSDPSLPLSHFIVLSCFPIEIQNQNDNKLARKGQKSTFNYTLKVVLIAVFIRVYNYSDYIHPNIIMFIYCVHVYFTLEITLAVLAGLGRTMIGAELEAQFNEPYLSTSLQDFWGRRWNIMVSRTLRPSVYDPICRFCTKIMGRVWARPLAVFSTFVVSAVMHELIFYYLGRLRPTGGVTWFFLLHGACLVVEMAIKKVVNDRWRVPQMVSGILTVGFVIGTGFWLFLPELLRFNTVVRAFEEYAVVGSFLEDFNRALRSSFFKVKQGVVS